MIPNQPFGNVRGDVLKLVAFTVAVVVGVFAIGSFGTGSVAPDPFARSFPTDDCCSNDEVLIDGVHEAHLNEIYRVQGDPVMPRRLEDREKVNWKKNWNRMLARDEAMQFHAGERVRVIEVRRHVKMHDSVGPYYENWSRVQSLEKTEEAPVWVFDHLLHPAH